MRELFSMDGLVGRALYRATDLLTLSCLWVICSLPLFTMGASTAALYTMTLRIVRNEEGKIGSGFFRAFKDNFRQATWIHILTMLLMAAVGVYQVAVGVLPAGMQPVFRGASLLFWVLCLMEVLFVYPVQARFENRTLNIMKNAWLIAAGNLPVFFLVLVITGSPVILFRLHTGLFVRLFPLLLFFGPGVIAWLNSFLFQHCFKRYITEEEEETEA